MKRWIHAACLAGILAMASGQAQAASMEFVIGDHPDGNRAADGAYGLRLDAWYNSLFSVGVNIDVDGGGPVTITFDPDDLGAGATLSGQIKLTATTNGGSPIGDVWSVTYNLTGLSEYQGGFKATGGSGSIVDLTPDDVDSYFDEVNFKGKQDGAGYAFYFAPNGFRLDDHAGAGYSDTDWVGNGWVKGSYYDKKCQCKKYWGGSGSNDFLVTAQPSGDLPDVPEPSTMLLTMGGVALLWFRKRRS